MILQNIIWKEATKETRELYYRSQSQIHLQDKLMIVPGTSFATDTYINLFDVETWSKYTTIEKVVLKIELRGSGRIFLRTMGQEVKEQVYKFQNDKKEEILISVPSEWNGKVYFEIMADEEVEFYGACYIAREIEKKPVKLAIVICTYKREQLLKKLLMELKRAKAILKEQLEVNVVDNASELDLGKESWVRFFHNPNTGGSGGFGRGMDEVVKHYNEFAATHVLLMDDDVEVQTESIVRLYAVLSCVKEEYQQEIVAGRMFRMDKPWIQYTAAEIWNGGDLQHIGFELDVSNRENLERINDNAGAEYSGWWFCCIPYEFVKDNRPLPFFLHCDDVEYGLRHGGAPIILNGIQVWHETYEYRQSPVMAYYDMRNSLLVNEIYGQLKPKEELLTWWKKKITKAHLEKDYQLEYMLILGMWDFLKGIKWLKRIDAERNHVHRICALKIKNKLMTAVMWRVTWLVSNKMIKIGVENESI